MMLIDTVLQIGIDQNNKQHYFDNISSDTKATVLWEYRKMPTCESQSEASQSSRLFHSGSETDEQFHPTFQ